MHGLVSQGSQWDGNKDFSCLCAQSCAQTPGPAEETQRKVFIQHNKHDRNLVYQQSPSKSARLSWWLRCISASFKHGCFTAPLSARLVFEPLWQGFQGAPFWGAVARPCSQAVRTPLLENPLFFSVSFLITCSHRGFHSHSQILKCGWWVFSDF